MSFCSGDVPADVVPYLCSASLSILKKKFGGLRPVAVGEVLRRLVLKCISLSVSAQAVKIPSPLQLGVRVPFGYEAIVHSVNAILDDNTIPSNCKLTLQVDFSNAFNSIDRGALFKEIHAHIPSMVAWMELYYCFQPLLCLGGRCIKSCCGVQQGGSFGPSRFCSGTSPYC